jgi:predicted O-methyltransferase YrrM
VPKKLKLSVAVAHFPYGGNGATSSEHPHLRHWEVETALKMRGDDRIESFTSKDFSDTPITMTRNRAMMEAKRAGIDLLLMVDSDQSPDKHRGEAWFKPFWDVAFDFLYENYHKGPRLIFAPYCGPPDDLSGENVYVFQWATNGARGHETQFSLEPYNREQAALMSGIQEAAAGPTGMLLMDTRLLDLIEPSGLPKRHVLERLQAGEMSVEEAMWALKEGYCHYEWNNSYAAEKASTEDVTLTRDISMAGIAKLGYNPVFCAWDSWIGHHKPWNVGKPRIYSADRVAETLRRAILQDHRDNEVILDLDRLNIGDPTIEAMRRLGAPPALVDNRGVSRPQQNGHAPEAPKRLDIPFQPAMRLATNAAQGKQLIVDIGPGKSPFHAAHEYVGRKFEGQRYGDKPFHELNLEVDRLPYADQSVDFVFCRHVIEDLNSAEHLLSEIRRVAKAGYIETPSPAVESSEGVDAPGSNVKGRGYGHHRNIVWSDGSELFVLPKMPAWDKLALPDCGEMLKHHELWNSYHLWEGELKYKVLRNEVDYWLGADDRYQKLAAGAIKSSVTATAAMFAKPREVVTSGERATFGQWTAHVHAPDEQCAALSDLVRSRAYALGRQVRALEVGTWLGTTAKALANAGATVHCVDTWAGSPGDVTEALVKEAGGPDAVYAEFVKRMGPQLDKTIFPFRGTSAENAAKYWDKFDIIFIDADHSYEAVKADIEHWWPHLADDGIMVGHDFATQGSGVSEAVTERFGEDIRTFGWHPQGAMWMVEKKDFLSAEEKSNGQLATV